MGYKLNIFTGQLDNAGGSGGGGGGANTSLSNLTPTSINESLIPNAAGTLDLGSGLNPWAVTNTTQILVDSIEPLVGPDLSISGATNIDVNGAAIINLLNPVNPQDAATKDYVDNSGGGTPTGDPNTVGFFNASGDLSSNVTLKFFEDTNTIVNCLSDTTLFTGTIQDLFLNGQAHDVQLSTVSRTIVNGDAIIIQGTGKGGSNENSVITGSSYTIAGAARNSFIGGFSHTNINGVLNSLLTGDTHDIASINGSIVAGSTLAIIDSSNGFISGANHTINGIHKSLIIGDGNNVSSTLGGGGDNNIIGGLNNIADGTTVNFSNTLLVGNANVITDGAENCIIGGALNTLSQAGNALVIGDSNDVTGFANVALIGSSNVATRSNQLIVGGSVTPSSQAIFAAGNGSAQLELTSTFGTVILRSPNRFRKGNETNYIEEQYFDEIEILASQTDLEITELTYAATDFQSMEVSYKVEFDGIVTAGHLIIANTSTDADIYDIVQAVSNGGAANITFSVLNDGSDVKLRYTTGAGTNGFMRTDFKKFRT